MYINSEELHKNLIVAETITVKQTVLIPRIKLAPSDINWSFVLEHHQFPVRLAYLMTTIRLKVRLLIKLKFTFRHQCSVMSNCMLLY